jgi:hypothetical protein
VLKTYEVVITILFLVVLGWALRSRDPINVGAVFGGFMLFGLDWLWCSRGFWNATVNPDLAMIPGIDILGQRYPISICFLWSVGFGFLPLAASKFYGPIGRTLGRWHFPVVFVAAAVIDWLVEVVCISGVGVWSYHQAREYMFGGVLWSNSWFLGGLLTASYFGLAHVKKWAAIPEGAGLSLTSETTWKGVLMAAATILTSAFLLGVLQLFWWSATHPWIESGRQF